MGNRRNFVQKAFLTFAGYGLVPGLVAKSQVNQALKSGVGIPLSEDEELRKISALINGKVPLKWVFAGDSITQGAKHTFGSRSYPEIFAERIRWELGRPRDFVINTAISGNTSKDVLHDFEWRIGQFKPNLVSLMIGTNDASEKKEISITSFRLNTIYLWNC